MSACKATLSVGDKQYVCDVEQPHPGIAHRNRDARAHWCSDGEARRVLNNARTKTKTS